MNKSKNKGKGGPNKKSAPTSSKNKGDSQSSTSQKNENTKNSSNEASQNSAKSNSKMASSAASSNPNPTITTTTVTIPPPSPNPIVCLGGAESPVTAVQFIMPPLKTDTMSASHMELLRATYGNLDISDVRDVNVKVMKNNRTTIIRTPPPGFLHPTSYVAAGMQSGEFSLWELKTKTLLLTWQGHVHNASVLCMKCITPNQLISYGRGDCVKLWHIIFPGDPPGKNLISPTEPKEDNLFENTKVKVVCSHKIRFGNYSGFAGCDVFKQFNIIVAAVPGSYQDMVTVWKLNGEMRLMELSVNESNKVGSVMNIKWIERRTVMALLVAYESGDVCLWDWANKNIYSTGCVKDNPVCVEYDPTHSAGVIGTVSEKIWPFTVGPNFQLSITKYISITNEGIGSCITRPDSKIYVTGGWDNMIRVYTWQKNRLLAVLKMHKRSISSIHFSPSKITCVEANTKEEPSLLSSQHFLAAGSTDGNISIWKIF